jgi:RNA polymerase sigma factor (TIGR02999 family)
MSGVDDLTKLLESVHHGDTDAAERLMNLVYGELRSLAASKMSRENPEHTLQPTALVHEAWLRLSGDNNGAFLGRSHFFKAAAEAMRRILIESARRRNALKRGSGLHREDDAFEKLEFSDPAPSEDILAIHEALDELARKDPVAADLVKLRYFTGMRMDEAASALGMPLRSTERLWSYARAWLRRWMDSEPEP